MYLFLSIIFITTLGLSSSALWCMEDNNTPEKQAQTHASAPKKDEGQLRVDPLPLPRGFPWTEVLRQQRQIEEQRKNQNT